MLKSKQELIALAKQQGYRPEILEKVLWLLDILEQINELLFLFSGKCPWCRHPAAKTAG